MKDELEHHEYSEIIKTQTFTKNSAMWHSITYNCSIVVSTNKNINLIAKSTQLLRVKYSQLKGIGSNSKHPSDIANCDILVAEYSPSTVILP